MSPIPGVDAATQIQMAQAQELLHEVRNSPTPVVICGDFNSDALHAGGLDTTPTALLIQTAGYPEVWPLFQSGAGDTGPTWPRYLRRPVNPSPFLCADPHPWSGSTCSSRGTLRLSASTGSSPRRQWLCHRSVQIAGGDRSFSALEAFLHGCHRGMLRVYRHGEQTGNVTHSGPPPETPNWRSDPDADGF